MKNSPIIIDSDGWLNHIKHHPSPNFDDRPSDTSIDLLVIHNISLPPEQFGDNYILDFFTNQLDATAHPYFKEIADMTVSAHVLIRRDGEIIQLVSFNKRAWHAGQSNFNGQERCNDFSIGIELEGSDTQIFTEDQYHSLITITQILLNNYSELTPDRITGHSDISPGRKTDPGDFFDWKRYKNQL